MMSMCTVFSCVVGRGCLLWPVHLLGRTLLAFPLLHSVSKTKFACYSRCFLTSYFCIPVPIYTGVWWRICLQWRRPWFDPWVKKIPGRRERLPTPVFLPGNSHHIYRRTSFLDVIVTITNTTGWVPWATETYFLTALEATSVRPRFGQCCFFLKLFSLAYGWQHSPSVFTSFSSVLFV